MCCTDKLISTYLATSCPHFSGQGDFLKPHIDSLWTTLSFCFITAPHSQVMIFIGHSSKWAKQSRLLTVSLHRRQGTSTWRHVVLTCSLAMSRLNFSLQARHSPCWVATILLANMLLQNCTTTWRQWAQEIGPAVSLKRSTQDPQYVCPHGIPICAFRTGFVLQREDQKFR